LPCWEYWANSDSIDFNRGKRQVGLTIVSSSMLPNIQNRYKEVKRKKNISKREFDKDEGKSELDF